MVKKNDMTMMTECEYKKLNGRNKHMKSVWVYRWIGDKDPIGEIVLFKHHKDAKKKMITDVEKYFAVDFDTLKETTDEYNGLYIGDNEIIFDIERWEVFKRRVI